MLNWWYSQHVRLPLKVRLTMFSYCCSGEAIIGGVTVALAVKLIHITDPEDAALAVKLIHITDPEDAALAEQEVQALQAVQGQEHIPQYVVHNWTANNQTLLLSTRCVTLHVH